MEAIVPGKIDGKTPTKFPGLFVGTAERWWLNASLDWAPGSLTALSLYADGYRQAAEHLGRAAARRHSPFMIDAVVCPLVFLWRHYIEIRLKEIIFSTSALLGEPPPNTVEESHNLDFLWKKARSLLHRALSPNEKQLAQADHAIAEFHKHDPTSQAFRYAEDKKGKPSAPTQIQINISHFNRQMRRLARFLEGMSIVISVRIQEYESNVGHW